MIGGIYCEAALGPIYDNGKLMSVRQGMRQLFEEKNLTPRGETLNEQIINYWYEEVSTRMSKILSSWKAPRNREFFNRTTDLTRSICLGVYYNGKLRRMYRFNGGHREKMPMEPSNDATVSDTIRMEELSIYHPDPASRAKQFLEEYDLIHKKDFTVVIAATMPYAVRLEKAGGVGKDGKRYSGYGLHVLKDVVNRMLAGVYNFKKQNFGGVLYGYVFETGGVFA
jgi:hypothetical protein